MFESLYILKGNVYFALFALLLFFVGFCASYVVYSLNIKILLAFPKWFISVMSKHINPKAKFLKIFLVIFLFNSVSIFIYMLSGLFVIFPYIITFLTGMNIGLTVFIPQSHHLEGYEVRELKGPLHAVKFMFYSTCVLVFEIVTFSIALGMGMSLADAILSVGNFGTDAYIYVAELIMLRVSAYLIYCIPTLAVSAYMEASVIKGV